MHSPIDVDLLLLQQHSQPQLMKDQFDYDDVHYNENEIVLHYSIRVPDLSE